MQFPYDVALQHLDMMDYPSVAFALYLLVADTVVLNDKAK